MQRHVTRQQKGNLPICLRLAWCHGKGTPAHQPCVRGVDAPSKRSSISTVRCLLGNTWKRASVCTRAKRGSVITLSRPRPLPRPPWRPLILPTQQAPCLSAQTHLKPCLRARQQQLTDASTPSWQGTCNLVEPLTFLKESRLSCSYRFKTWEGSLASYIRLRVAYTTRLVAQALLRAPETRQQ